MQLNRYIAQCGITSRRKAAELIESGRIRVNGERITEFMPVNPETDRVTLDGEPLSLPERYRYILLNKPAGVLTTVEDDFGRSTVLDVVRVKERVFPVGRLDADTTGALLLTNDGDLAQRLAHPRYGVEKVYHAWVRGKVTPRVLARLEEGVSIGDIVVSGEVKEIKRTANQTLLEIQIHQGKKRQIKRMMRAVGHPVLNLQRVRFAGLRIDTLPVGTWRDLRTDEIALLKQKAGLVAKP